MNHLYLIKIGEIALKKGNRPFFERLLKQEIKKKLPGSGTVVNIRSGRYYLETEEAPPRVEQALAHTPGIVAFTQARGAAKELDALEKEALKTAGEHMAAKEGNRFKFEVRRTDKSLPLDSYGYARELGARLLKAMPELQVDVHKPQWTIRVELRERAYIYSREKKGAGGLPAGASGEGMLLLSGGLDSPAAGYLMAKRGIRLKAVHFHTPPYTSPEAKQKALDLAALLAPWCGGLQLYLIPFTPVQTAINKGVPSPAVTLHSRAAMMRIAEKLSPKALSLITGESLGQVASQTQESLSYTDQAAGLPVFRPLAGMDKEEIITIARKIDTYETSIRPFDDCCTLFSAPHPLTRPDREEQKEIFRQIPQIEELMEQAAREKETLFFDAWGKPQEEKPQGS